MLLQRKYQVSISLEHRWKMVILGWIYLGVGAFTAYVLTALAVKQLLGVNLVHALLNPSGSGLESAVSTLLAGVLGFAAFYIPLRRHIERRM